MRLHLPILLVVGLGLAGCQSVGPTTVGGEAALSIDASTSARITLPAGTALPLGSTSGTSGLVAGHCTLGSGATHIGLERTAHGAVVPSGFVWFQLRVDSPDAPLGRVMAEYEGELYEGDCDLSSFERNRDTGSLQVAVSACSLLTPSPIASGPTSVTFDAALSFYDCTRQ